MEDTAAQRHTQYDPTGVTLHVSVCSLECLWGTTKEISAALHYAGLEVSFIPCAVVLNF